MKRVLLSLAFVGGIFTSPTLLAQETGDHDHNHEIVSDYDWVHIKTENGISISYAKFNQNGQDYIRIQLENTTNKFIEVIWSLHKGNDEIINETSNRLWENASLIYDTTLLIPMSSGDVLTDFVLTIKKINEL